MFDAGGDWHTAGLGAARSTNKPVKYLVLTHHHMDHVGGVRVCFPGRDVVVGKAAASTSVASSPPFCPQPDLPARDLGKTPIVEAAEKRAR